MHTSTWAALTAAALTIIASPVGAVTITFDEPGTVPGSVITNQYAALGAVFSANAFSGPGSSTSGQPWATNTDMTVAPTTGAGANVGGLGTPSLVSGNLLHGYAGWLNQDGDASFRISFAMPVDYFSASFAGVNDLSDTRVYFFDGSTKLSVVSGTGQPASGQFVLSGSFAGTTSVVVVPGSFNDWVGVDNIVFIPTAVPEPAAFALMALGLGWLRVSRRQR
jgi:hypothetical protein